MITEDETVVETEVRTGNTSVTPTMSTPVVWEGVLVVFVFSYQYPVSTGIPREREVVPHFRKDLQGSSTGTYRVTGLGEVHR